MKESYLEGLPTHNGIESCGAAREGSVETLAGKRAGRVAWFGLLSLFPVGLRFVRRDSGRHGESGTSSGSSHFATGL